MTRKQSLPPIDTYRLINDGTESPIRFGIHRACKNGVVTLDDDQEQLILDSIHHELMIWFCETFRFGDGYDE